LLFLLLLCSVFDFGARDTLVRRPSTEKREKDELKFLMQRTDSVSGLPDEGGRASCQSARQSRWSLCRIVQAGTSQGNDGDGGGSGEI